ncbi:MAG: hypothetical protein ACE5IO_10605, partial [Thermoplasmata archaeon]
MRIFALVTAVLIGLGAFSGLIGFVKASDGLLNPPHSDFAIDTSMPPNGLYDQLIVNVSIDVTVAGMFFVVGDLYDNSGLNLIENQSSME